MGIWKVTRKHLFNTEEDGNGRIEEHTEKAKWQMSSLMRNYMRKKGKTHVPKIRHKTENIINNLMERKGSLREYYEKICQQIIQMKWKMCRMPQATITGSRRNRKSE